MEPKLLAGLLLTILMVTPMLAQENQAVSTPPAEVEVIYPNGLEIVNGTVNITANATDGDIYEFQFVQWWWKQYGGPANLIGQTNATNCSQAANQSNSFNCYYDWNTTYMKNGSGYQIYVTAFYDVVINNMTVEQDILLADDESDDFFSIVNT